MFLFFNPLTFFFMILFFLFLAILFIIVQINVIVLAFARIGIPTEYLFLTLFATLLGSFVNLPVKRVPQEYMVTETWISYFGFRYVIPVRGRRETVLAVNVGGHSSQLSYPSICSSRRASGHPRYLGRPS